jgi:methylated-DNA-protein-cysteine methyltransferase-like protein
MERIVGPGFHGRVYDIVLRIPPGRVSTYGDIAEALGSRRVARKVGHALAAIPADRDDVPWHRVVNAKGRVSRRAHGSLSDEQVLLLKAEGIEVGPTGAVVEFGARSWKGA